MTTRGTPRTTDFLQSVSRETLIKRDIADSHHDKFTNKGNIFADTIPRGCPSTILDPIMSEDKFLDAIGLKNQDLFIRLREDEDSSIPYIFSEISFNDGEAISDSNIEAIASFYTQTYSEKPLYIIDFFYTKILKELIKNSEKTNHNIINNSAVSYDPATKIKEGSDSYKELNDLSDNSIKVVEDYEQVIVIDKTLSCTGELSVQDIKNNYFNLFLSPKNIHLARDKNGDSYALMENQDNTNDITYVYADKKFAAKETKGLFGVKNIFNILKNIKNTLSNRSKSNDEKTADIFTEINKITNEQIKVGKKNTPEHIIAKRMGDALQAISVLLYGVNGIFVSHDRLAIALAIYIGVPNIIYMNRSNINGVKRNSVTLIQHNSLQSPEVKKIIYGRRIHNLKQNLALYTKNNVTSDIGTIQDELQAYKDIISDSMNEGLSKELYNEDIINTNKNYQTLLAFTIDIIPFLVMRDTIEVLNAQYSNLKRKPELSTLSDEKSVIPYAGTPQNEDFIKVLTLKLNMVKLLYSIKSLGQVPVIDEDSLRTMKEEYRGIDFKISNSNKFKKIILCYKDNGRSFSRRVIPNILKSSVETDTRVSILTKLQQYLNDDEKIQFNTIFNNLLIGKDSYHDKTKKKLEAMQILLNTEIGATTGGTSTSQKKNNSIANYEYGTNTYIDEIIVNEYTSLLLVLLSFNKKDILHIFKNYKLTKLLLKENIVNLLVSLLVFAYYNNMEHNIKTKKSSKIATPAQIEVLQKQKIGINTNPEREMIMVRGGAENSNVEKKKEKDMIFDFEERYFTESIHSMLVTYNNEKEDSDIDNEQIYENFSEEQKRNITTEVDKMNQLLYKIPQYEKSEWFSSQITYVGTIIQSGFALCEKPTPTQMIDFFKTNSEEDKTRINNLIRNIDTGTNRDILNGLLAKCFTNEEIIKNIIDGIIVRTILIKGVVKDVTTFLNSTIQNTNYEIQMKYIKQCFIFNSDKVNEIIISSEDYDGLSEEGKKIFDNYSFFVENIDFYYTYKQLIENNVIPKQTIGKDLDIEAYNLYRILYPRLNIDRRIKPIGDLLEEINSMYDYHIIRESKPEEAPATGAAASGAAASGAGV